MLQNAIYVINSKIIYCQGGKIAAKLKMDRLHYKYTMVYYLFKKTSKQLPGKKY